MKRFLIPGLCAAGLILCEGFGLPVWLLSAGLLILVLMGKETPLWLGYFLRGTAGWTKAAVRLYDIGWRRGGRAAAPAMDCCALLMQDGQYVRAKSILKELLNTGSLTITMEVICRQYLALAFEKTGDLSQAIGIMEAVRREQECLRSDFYGTLAYFYLEAGEYGKAQEINELARQRDEENPVVYDNAALIAYQTGKKKEAWVLFQRALELDGKLISPKYYLGLLAEEQGDKAEAGRWFRQVWESEITGLNTVTRRQAEEKRLEYQHWEEAYEA